VLLHDGEVADDDLGARADEHLALATPSLVCWCERKLTPSPPLKRPTASTTLSTLRSVATSASHTRPLHANEGGLTVLLHDGEVADDDLGARAPSDRVAMRVSVLVSSRPPPSLVCWCERKLTPSPPLKHGRKVHHDIECVPKARREKESEYHSEAGPVLTRDQHRTPLSGTHESLGTHSLARFSRPALSETLISRENVCRGSRAYRTKVCGVQRACRKGVGAKRGRV
jgi:hypothetical protein